MVPFQIILQRPHLPQAPVINTPLQVGAHAHLAQPCLDGGGEARAPNLHLVLHKIAQRVTGAHRGRRAKRNGHPRICSAHRARRVAARPQPVLPAHLQLQHPVAHARGELPRSEPVLQLARTRK